MASNIHEQLKTMDYEDRMTYREVVERRLDDLQRMSGELSQESESIKDFIDSDPVATFRGKKYGQKVGLIYLLKGGQFPDTLSRKQAQMLLMGRELKHNALDSKGRVRWEYIMDELAEHFGMSEKELVDHVEKIKDDKERLKDLDILISEAADREKELNKIMDELRQYDKIGSGEPTKYAQPYIQQTPGEPEAGIQKGFMGQDKEVHPKGKGEVKQVNIFDHAKLQEYKQKVKKSDDIYGDLMAEVRKIQEDRTPRAVAADSAHTAQHVVKGESIKRWLKDPAHYDIKGVDTKRARKPRTGGARVRVSK